MATQTTKAPAHPPLASRPQKDKGTHGTHSSSAKVPTSSSTSTKPSKDAPVTLHPEGRVKLLEQLKLVHQRQRRAIDQLQVDSLRQQALIENLRVSSARQGEATETLRVQRDTFRTEVARLRTELAGLYNKFDEVTSEYDEFRSLGASQPPPMMPPPWTPLKTRDTVRRTMTATSKVRQARLDFASDQKRGYSVNGPAPLTGVSEPITPHRSEVAPQQREARLPRYHSVPVEPTQPPKTLKRMPSMRPRFGPRSPHSKTSSSGSVPVPPSPPSPPPPTA